MKNRDDIFAHFNNPTLVYDVVIVGGGITGAGVARDCVSRGLKTLILDKLDFASGTSSKSGKLIHGGFRYLQYGHLKLVFESCSERDLLQKVVAPHLIRPAHFYYPFYKSSHTPRWLVACGLAVYDLLSMYRNIAHSSWLSKKSLAKIFPRLLSSQAIGALSFYDGKALDFRLVIDTLKAMTNLGGDALNYCEVLDIKRENSLFTIHCKDSLNQKTYDIKSHVVINASGPWADEVLKRSHTDFRFNLHTTSGIHFIVDQKILACSEILTLEHPKDHRHIYIIPWDNKVLIGTTDLFFSGNLDQQAIDPNAVEYLLQGVNHYFPEIHLERHHIDRIMSGVRPLMGGTSAKDEAKMSRDFSMNLDPSGFASITGGKLTTYRVMAQMLVDKIMHAYFPNRTFKTSQTAKALELSRPLPSPTSPKLLTGFPLTQSELDLLLKQEWIEKLSDIIFRRTEMGWFYLEHLEKDLPIIAKYVAEFKGWDEQRLAQEIAECWQEVKL